MEQTRPEPAQGNDVIETALLEQAPASIVVVDRCGGVVYWNRASERLFGRPRAEAVRRRIDELLGPGDGRAEIRERLLAVRPWEGELKLRRPDGSAVAVEVRVAPVRNRRGQHVGAIALAFPASRAPADDPDEARAIGLRIARARRQAGLTQAALAGMLGVTKRSVQGYEAGSTVPYRHLERLGEALSRDPRWFLFGESTASDVAVREELREVVREELAFALRQAGLTGLSEASQRRVA